MIAALVVVNVMSDEERQTGAVSGTRVRVCYSDGLWYHGFIDSFHEPTGKYRISLDDGRGDRYGPQIRHGGIDFYH